MASLDKSKDNPSNSNSKSRPESPFFKRSYGGYTPEQLEFCFNQIGDIKKKTILDPMAGSGDSLSKIIFQGANVWLGDINPALVLLATLRHPQLIRQHKELTSWVLEKIKPLKPKSNDKQSLIYIEDWLSPRTREELSIYKDLFGFGAFNNPFSYNSLLWTGAIENCFAMSIPVLAARNLACFRSSDNKTWIKKGGLLRYNGIYELIVKSLKDWQNFAETYNHKNDIYDKLVGQLHIVKMNVELGCFGSCPDADFIITSPPYANRLDYSRLWGPEVEVLSAMWDEDSSSIKKAQIGSIVVKNNERDFNLIELPENIIDILEDIRKDGRWKASESYYYPFFKNYAISLSRSLKQMANKLKREGKLIIFVRDTVRKDTMFPTGDLVRAILSKNGLSECNKVRKILRGHVGLLRKSSSVGLYGLAQQEWWLEFQKK